MYHFIKALGPQVKMLFFINHQVCFLISSLS